MHMTLAVSTYQGEPPDTPLVCRFDAAGGTIGRGPGNTMVLPDAAKTVSRVQARIDCTNDGWRLADLGSNPSRLNGRLLASGQLARLSNGDRIEVGAYRIEVSTLGDVQPFDAPLGMLDRAHGAGLGEGGFPLDGGALGPARAFTGGSLAADRAAAVTAFTENRFVGGVAAAQAFTEASPHSLVAREVAPTPSLANDPLAGNGVAITRTCVVDSVSPAQLLANRPLPGSISADTHAFAEDPLARAAVLFGAPLPGAHFDPLGGPLPGARTLPRTDGRAAFAGSASDHIPPEQFAYTPDAAAIAAATPAHRGGIPHDYDPLDDVALAARAFAPAPAGEPRVAVNVAVPEARDNVTARAAANEVVNAASNGAATDATLAALLDGLGVDATVLRGRGAAEFAHCAGAMLRTAVRGTVDVLMSRSVMKRGMSVDTTLLVQRGNNPLKFFPDGDSALGQMLRGANAGYLTGEAALERAFDDIRRHELAVLGGMRAAMQHLLRRFDPEAIAGRDTSRGSLDWLPGRRKAKQWDRLVALHGELVRASGDDLDALCGSAFNDAYERQADGSPDTAPHGSSHA